MRAKPPHPRRVFMQQRLVASPAFVSQPEGNGCIELLERAGFAVSWERQTTAMFGDLGLFFAERREAPPLKAT